MHTKTLTPTLYAAALLALLTPFACTSSIPNQLAPPEPLAEAETTPELPPEPPEPPPPPPPTPMELATNAARPHVHAAAMASHPPTWRCSYRGPGALEKVKRRRRGKRPDIAKVEWERSEVLRERVGRDLDYYRRIRKAYVKRGVCHVEAFITFGIVDTTFLDTPLKVHHSAAPKLARAQSKLKTIYKNKLFSSIGAFNARTVRGPFGTTNRLSNHALGRAIDFDPGHNPYLSRKELDLIIRVTRKPVVRNAATHPSKRWSAFDALDTSFTSTIDEWERDTIKERDDLEALHPNPRRRPRRVRRALAKIESDLVMLGSSRNLRRAREQGFLSLERDFVLAMTEAGFSWATDFKAGPDLMHFELR